MEVCKGQLISEAKVDYEWLGRREWIEFNYTAFHESFLFEVTGEVHDVIYICGFK